MAHSCRDSLNLELWSANLELSGTALSHELRNNLLDQ